MSNMSKEEYRKLMKGIFEMQIKYIEEDMQGVDEWSERHISMEGEISGLRIAIDKLEDSAFLTVE